MLRRPKVEDDVVVGLVVWGRASTVDAEVVVTSDVRTAFSGVDVAVMMAKLDRKTNDDYQEYLRNVVRISRLHAAAIDKYAKKTVKVLVTRS